MFIRLNILVFTIFFITPSFSAELSVEDYMSGNLLNKEVEAHHVAKALIDLALSERTTGHVITVDGGNIAAALR